MQPGSPADPAFAPVTLPQAWQRDFEARDGARYRLLVSVPEGPAPAGGFPSLVLVDGHALFPVAATAARLQAQRPEATSVGPAVVIGIGYPGERAFDAERRQRDLLPVPDGADRVLDMIVDEVLPAVAQIAPLDPARRALAGHSYGGLFVLHALFTRPGLFQSLVAGSPSIWWQDRAILASEDAFRRSGSAPAGRLLITVGGQEQEPLIAVSPQRAERLARARMCDNAAEMAERLSASGRVDCSFTEFPGENHVSVILPMLARTVAFTLAGTAQDKAAARMMLDRRSLILGGLSLPVLPVPALAADPVVATDVLGRTVRLAAPAKRIVLAQGRQLNALGLIHPDPVSILAGWGSDLERQNPDGLARYRARFPAINALPLVGDGGTATGFSLERAIALGPDLVVLSKSLAGTRRGPGDLVEKLEAAGIPVAVVDFFLEPLRDTVPSLRALGILTGQQDQAGRLIAFYEERMKRIASRVADAKRPSVFIHAHAGGYDCCMTAGQGTFNEFIQAAGGHNIAAAMLPGATGQIGLEQLIGADPDVYVATGGTHLSKLGGLVLGLGVSETDAAASFAKLLGTPSLKMLSAIEKRRTFGFWHLFNDTPLHVVAIEALAKWLHPERFADIDPAATLAEGARFSAIPLDGTLWIAAPPKA